MKKELKATITDGEIFYYNLEQYKKFIEKNEGKHVTVILDSNKEKTNLQNKYLWGGVYETLTEYGENQMYWHAYWKCRLLLPKMIGREADMDRLMASGRMEYIAQFLTTTTLDRNEFMKYIEDIRNISSKEFGIYILSPEEYTRQSQGSGFPS
jgi:hypothetical protein